MVENPITGQDSAAQTRADVDRMTAEGASEAPAVDPTPQLADDAAQLRQERDALHDRLLRQAAEFDNYRKRIERERREMGEHAAADLLQELLPIIDDFERALQTEAGSGAESYRKGIEIIHRQLLDLLRKRGVTAIEVLGEDFDPRIHQSVSSEEAPDRREGEVIAELRPGYRLGDRLLRPALVKVAKT